MCLTFVRPAADQPDILPMFIVNPTKCISSPKPCDTLPLPGLQPGHFFFDHLHLCIEFLVLLLDCLVAVNFHHQWLVLNTSKGSVNLGSIDIVSLERLELLIIIECREVVNIENRGCMDEAFCQVLDGTSRGTRLVSRICGSRFQCIQWVTMIKGTFEEKVQWFQWKSRKELGFKTVEL